MVESADGAGRAGGDRDPYPRRTLWKSVSEPDAGGPSAEVPPGDAGGAAATYGLASSVCWGSGSCVSPARCARPILGKPVRARARVKRARIRERYFYKQEISENAVRYQEKAPEGRIELVLPYDGDRYFSRQARCDVDHARRPGSEALIGHLVLTGFEHANLDGLLDEGPTHGSVPILARIADLGGPDDSDPLIADRSACVVSHDYVPDTRHFKVDPADVDARLVDPDDAGFLPPDVASDFDRKRLEIMRQVGFLPELRLHMTVRLVIPRELAEGARASVRQVFISWPTHTSLRSLKRIVQGKRHPLRFRPQAGGPGVVEHHDDGRSRSGRGRGAHVRQPGDDPCNPPTGRAVPGRQP